MEQVNSEKFEVLRDQLKKLCHILLLAKEAFAIFETLAELKASNVVGQEEADSNVDVMNRYKDFFIPTLNAHRRMAILKTAHIFDKHKQALSIGKMLRKARGERPHLSKEAFLTANEGRVGASSLAVVYVGIDQSVVAEVEVMLKPYEDVIAKVQDIRDQYIAHTDWEPTDASISSGELADLLHLAKKTLNRLLYALNHETYDYSTREEYARKNTCEVIAMLRE